MTNTSGMLGRLGRLRHRDGGVGIDGVDDDRVAPQATKFWIWLNCLPMSRCASSVTLSFDASVLLGVIGHAVAQQGEEVVVELGRW